MNNPSVTIILMNIGTTHRTIFMFYANEIEKFEDFIFRFDTMLKEDFVPVPAKMIIIKGKYLNDLYERTINGFIKDKRKYIYFVSQVIN